MCSRSQGNFDTRDDIIKWKLLLSKLIMCVQIVIDTCHKYGMMETHNELTRAITDSNSLQNVVLHKY